MRPVPLNFPSHRTLGTLLALAGGGLLFGAALAPSAFPVLFPPAQGVGMNTAFAIALFGLMLARSLTRPDPVIEPLSAGVALLALASLAQYAAGFYPEDGPWRLAMNTLPAQGAWQGRMSPPTAMILLFHAASSLLAARRPPAGPWVPFLGCGLATLSALAYLMAHLADILLFDWKVAATGTLSPFTALLLTLLGVAHCGKLAQNTKLRVWLNASPGRLLFLQVSAILATLMVSGGMAAGSMVLRGHAELAISLSLMLAGAGGGLLYLRIVPLLERMRLAEGELATQSKRQELLLRHADQGVLGLDMEGRVTFINPAAEFILGRTTLEMVGQSIPLLVPIVDAGQPAQPASGNPILQTLRDGMTRHGDEEVLLHRDGREVAVEYSVAALRESGRISGAVMLVADVGERRRMMRDLRRWQHIFQYAEWGIVLGSPDRKTMELLNPAFARMHGYTVDELTGRPIPEVFAPEARAELPALLQKVHDEGHVRFESLHQHKDGHVFPVLVDATAVRDSGGNVLYRVVNVLDISDLRQVETALREREAALAVAQAQAHLGSWNLDIGANKLVWSDESYRIFGLPIGTALSYESFLACVHPEDRSFVDTRWKEAMAGAPYDIEHRILVDGNIRWVRERAELRFSPDRTLLGGVGTAQDITELKLKEQDLLLSRQMLRELAAHHEKIREEERGRIAREIHDELGQYLTALRMDAALLSIRFGKDAPAIEKHAKGMKETIDTTIGVVRNLASALRPGALDTGLVSAAEWLLTGFEERTGILCHLEAPQDIPGVDDARATAAFRILQESLTNVARHAQAGEVRVIIECGDKMLSMNISDDGQGFDPAEVRQKKTFGLMGIRERAMMFAGEARIESRPGAGTTVHVTLPLQPDNPGVAP